MTNSLQKPPIWFWIVSVIALVWNSLGVHGYISQAYELSAYTEAYNKEQLEVMSTLPAWYTALFAIALIVVLLFLVHLLDRSLQATPLQ